MAQLFHPTSNVLSKLTIVGIIMAVPLLGASVYAINMVYGYKYYVPVEQPVQFSHKHHVGDDGIDCRYCHTSVEKGASAGMPATHTCMSCHSQIWTDSPELQAVRASYTSGQPIRWNRVHDMPDFVYFNHSIHIKKGVGCETCHGRMDEKPLVWKSHTMTMAWCLDCHREPEKFIRPREAVFTMGWRPDKPQGTEAPSMGTAPTTLADAPAGRARVLAGKPAVRGKDEHAGAEHSGGEHSGDEHSGGEHSGGEHGDAKDSDAVATPPLEMGLRLKKEYNIRSARELTDCGTCHR